MDNSECLRNISNPISGITGEEQARSQKKKSFQNLAEFAELREHSVSFVGLYHRHSRFSRNVMMCL